MRRIICGILVVIGSRLDGWACGWRFMAEVEILVSVAQGIAFRLFL